MIAGMIIGISENNSVLLSVPITSCKIVGIFVSLCLIDSLGTLNSDKGKYQMVDDCLLALP